jgi:hypothetical protein
VSPVDCLKILFSIGLSLGLLVTVAYCGVIGYFPSGLSLADALFFIAVSLSFSCAYSLFVGFLFCAAVLFLPALSLIQETAIKVPVLHRKMADKDGRLRKVNFPRLKGVDFLMALVGVIFILFLIPVFFVDFFRASALLLCVVGMSVFYGFFHTDIVGEKDESEKLLIKRIFIVVIFLMPILLGRTQGPVLNVAMEWAGIRKSNVSVQLTEKYSAFLKNNGLPGYEEKGVVKGFYDDVTVLFGGVGEYTFLDVRGVKVAVKRDDVIIGKRPNSNEILGNNK